MAEATLIKEKQSSLSFGKKQRQLLTDPLDDNNPITVQVLGICSALAVTTGMKNALVMAIAVVFVCLFSNVIISAMRNAIPKQVRMIVQLVVIAALVTIVELTLKAVDYNVYKQLSVFVGLIITNCIIMGRLEAFASGNNVWDSMFDGIGNGIGYGIILLVVAFFRELLGKGSLFGFKIFGPGQEFMLNTKNFWLTSGYQHNNLMVLFPSAMIVIGLLIWWQRSRNPKLVDIS